MSELCNSHFSTLLISDLTLLISFILSHPLYFSYFIFFSPYLLTLISFLSPLFLTTFLLFLAFLAHTNSSISNSQTHLTSILKRLQFSKDPTNYEQGESDDLGIYEILFSPPSVPAVREQFETPIEASDSDQSPSKDRILEPIPPPGSAGNKVSAAPAVMAEKRLENFLKILDEFEKLASNAGDHDKEKGMKKKKQAAELPPPPSPPPENGAKIDKAVEEKKQLSLLINGGSEAENAQNQANSAAAKLESPPPQSPSPPPTNGAKIEKALDEKKLINGGSEAENTQNQANSAATKLESPPQPSPTKNGAKIDKAVEEKNPKSQLINGGSEAENPQNRTKSAAAKLESNNSTMSKSKSQSHRFFAAAAAAGDDRESLSSYGSMRREREWKRTLACKLFEERHNGGAAAAAAGCGGGEAMDSLWEAYEVESSKNSSKRSERGRRGRGREINEEDDVVGAQLCCLQALKMSAGKMNLGVGRPNLVKISKAIKGIGWLHSLTKNSKKVHNNGDHRY